MWWYLSRMAKTFRDGILLINSSMVIDYRRDVGTLLAALPKTLRASIPLTWSDMVIGYREAVGEARLVAAGSGMAGAGVE